MKKLISLLSVLTITGAAMPNFIAASNYEKQYIKTLKRTKRENNDKFLPKLIKNTKLGKIPTNNEENILDQVVRLNRNINRNDIAINRLLNNQAQIVLRETLENNSFPENNFIWVTFETDPDIQIQLGNSIFYSVFNKTDKPKPKSNYFIESTSNTFNLGIIPDNRGITIMELLRSRKEAEFFVFQENLWRTSAVLSNITTSSAILSMPYSLDEKTMEDILVTFTPQRIDLNSIITITDLGTINNNNVLERIIQLYPQLRNANIYVTFISPMVARIFVSDDDPLYFGSVSVSFENNVGDKINKKETEKKMIQIQMKKIQKLIC